MEAKAEAYKLYNQTAAMPAMLPWSVAAVEEARREMGEDWWPYGVGPNRHVLEAFLAPALHEPVAPGLALVHEEPIALRLQPPAFLVPHDGPGFRIRPGPPAGRVLLHPGPGLAFQPAPGSAVVPDE